MKTANQNNFKDVFYHCIPVLNAHSEQELRNRIRNYASELYESQQSLLKRLIGDNISKENWVRRSQRMIVHPDYDNSSGTAYISIRKCGRIEDCHELLVDLLATKLMSKAPVNYPVQKTIVSSDKSMCSKTFPWLIYENGRLVNSGNNSPDFPTC